LQPLGYFPQVSERFLEISLNMFLVGTFSSESDISSEEEIQDNEGNTSVKTNV
jgi:hypothetical protein